MTTSKQTDAYVVRVGDAQVGPVTLDQLRRGLKAGKIPEHAVAKAAEGEDWKPVSEVAMRIVLPPPRSPPNLGQPEPSWSAFQGGEVVTPSDAPPLPLSLCGAMYGVWFSKRACVGDELYLNAPSPLRTKGEPPSSTTTLMGYVGSPTSTELADQFASTPGSVLSVSFWSL